MVLYKRWKRRELSLSCGTVQTLEEKRAILVGVVWKSADVEGRKEGRKASKKSNISPRITDITSAFPLNGYVFLFTEEDLDSILGAEVPSAVFYWHTYSTKSLLFKQPQKTGSTIEGITAQNTRDEKKR